MAGSIEVHQPSDWDDAWQVLSRTGGNAIPLMLGPHPEPLAEWDAGAVVDMSRLGLDTIKTSAGGEVRLGALTRLQELVESPALKTRDGSLLSIAAQHVAPIGMRNLASIGGAVCEKGGPPEVILALLALDACIVVRTEGDAQNEIPIVGFLEKSSPEAGVSQVVVEVILPFLNGHTTGWGMERVARTPKDAAIVAAVAYLEVDNGLVRHARLAMAGVSSFPQRFTAVEDMLAGQAITDELLHKASEAVSNQVNPVADYRGSAAYRQAMAAVLSRRALQSAWKQATAGENLQLEK